MVLDETYATGEVAMSGGKRDVFWSEAGAPRSGADLSGVTVEKLKGPSSSGRYSTMTT